MHRHIHTATIKMTIWLFECAQEHIPRAHLLEKIHGQMTIAQTHIRSARLLAMPALPFSLRSESVCKQLQASQKCAQCTSIEWGFSFLLQPTFAFFSTFSLTAYVVAEKKSFPNTNRICDYVVRIFYTGCELFCTHCRNSTNSLKNRQVHYKQARWILTVRLPRFFTLHIKCTFLPTKPVIFDGMVESKYGPVPGVGNSCKKSVKNRLEPP